MNLDTYTEMVMDIFCKQCNKCFTKTLENQRDIIPGFGLFQETCTHCCKMSTYSINRVTLRTIEVEL